MKRLLGFITVFCLFTALSATGLTVIKKDSVMDSRFIGKWVCKSQTFKNKQGIVTRQVIVENLFREISAAARVADYFQMSDRRMDVFSGNIEMLTDSTLKMVSNNNKVYSIYPQLSHFLFRFSRDSSMVKLKMRVPSSAADHPLYYEEIWVRLVDKPKEHGPNSRVGIGVACR